MSSPPLADRALADAALRRLQGCVVLVSSTRDHRHPPTAMRGWLEVHESAGAPPEVSLAVEFPQMFTTRAHRRTLPLDAASLERLLASECNGAFTFSIDEELN